MISQITDQLQTFVPLQKCLKGLALNRMENETKGPEGLILKIALYHDCPAPTTGLYC